VKVTVKLFTDERQNRPILSPDFISRFYRRN